MTRLTFDKGSDLQPVWTPDSKQVLFFSERGGKFGGIFRKQADGAGEEQELVAPPDRQLYPWVLSSDGKTLVVLDTPDPYTKGDLSMLSMEGDHARKSLLQNPDYLETQPRLSPDGKWIAYVTNESGQTNIEVYVRPFPEVNKGRWQISTNGGTAPLWSPNGRELYYLSEEDGGVTVVPVETGETFRAGTPKKLFSRTPYWGGGNTPGTAWDISPDGKRFLMLKLPSATPSAPAGARKFTIVLNWTEELKQRVPVK
jgi:serine/threonine-protein kinase